MGSLVKYAKSGDVHIAYSAFGSGPLDLILAPGFISHVEFQMRHPKVAHCAERLASFCRLIVFDKRGTGLSDPVAAATSLEERVDDLRAVLDAVGSTQATILGYSEGGPMALLFAAAYPARTTSLILYGSYARTMWAPDYPMGITPEQLGGLHYLVDRWGEGVGLAAWAPSLAHDTASREWWAELQRVSASPGMIKSLIALYPLIDVRSILSSIRTPTLVLHRAGDRISPVANGRYLAEHIAGSKYVELDGVDHQFFAGDSDGFMDEIEEFMTGVRHTPEHDRSLLTILFTDVVASTEHMEQIGDRRWKDLMERHHQVIRTQLARFRGTEVDNAGDGFFATFDGPARAARCADAIRGEMRSVGLELRAGLHTGECISVAGKVSGLAVHIAARVAAAARAGEILVTSTVKDLVVGSGLKFSGGSSHELKGIREAWQLFRLES